MNTELIFSQGGVEVPNPAYNSRSKKRGVSPTIIVPDASQTSSMADIAYRSNPSLYGQYSYDDVKKYYGEGLMPNKISPNLDVELAEAQSGIKKFGNALAQTLVSEIALGTAIGITDLLDVVGNAISLNANNDYQNPISRTLTEWQEKFRNEVAPIHADPTKNIANGGLLDMGWWASNIPSIASSLTLLLPSTGVTKGLSTLAKSTNIGAYTRTAVRAATKKLGNKSLYRTLNRPSTITAWNRGIELGINAGIQRTMENYQEARQVYNDSLEDSINTLQNMSPEEYQDMLNRNRDMFEGVDTNNVQEVAKAIARRASDRTFAMDFANIGFDVMQLYALKNVFGNNGLANVGRASARRANRLSIKYAGKSQAEIDKLEAARPWKERALDNIKDYAIGSGYAIKAQLSEGVEEAVNYIAQEEGMSLGRTILGKENPSSFDYRLKQYMFAPQLWESAFWGTLGGVTFQAAGSGLMRVANTIKKGTEVDPITGERRQNVAWAGLSMLPEVERRVKDIESRNIKMGQLAELVKTIDKDHKNPFQRNADGNFVDIPNKIDQDAAKELAINEFVTDIALQANNNGNYEATREYLANDNVRQAMVQAGIVDEASSKEWQQSVLEKYDRVKEQYENELFKLDDLAATTDVKGKVPIEFLQNAATFNVQTKLNIANLRNQQAAYTEQYNKAKADAIENGKLDAAYDYDSIIKLSTIVSGLNALYQQRKEIQDDIKQNGATVAKQISLDEINKRITKLQKDFYIDNSTNQLVSLLAGLSSIYNSRAKNEEIDKNLEKALNDALQDNKFGGIESLLGLEPDTITVSEEEHQNIVSAYNKFNKEFINRTEGEQGINQIGKQNVEAFSNAVALSYTIANQQSQVIDTQSDLDYYLNMMNNSMDEARRNAIEESYDVIRELSKKYGRRSVEGALAAAYYGDSVIEANGIANYEEEDKARIDRAIKVLNLTSAPNRVLYDDIKALLDIEDKLSADKRANTEVLSTTNQNPVQSTETSQTNNPSAGTSETATAQGNGQNSDVSSTQTPPQTVSTELINVRVGTRSGNPFIAPISNTGTQNQNGTLVPTTVAGRYRLQTQEEQILNNDNFYDKENGVSVIDGDYKVTQEPIVVLDNNGKYIVEEKGLLSKINDEKPPVEENGRAQQGGNTFQEAIRDKEVQQGVVQQSQDDATSSTGVESPVDNYIPIEDLGQAVAARMTDINVLDPNLDLDAKAQQYKEQLNPEEFGVTKEELDKVIDERIAGFKQLKDHIATLQSPQAQAATGIAFAARLMEPTSNIFSLMFASSMSSFVQEYAKSMIIPKTTDGRYVINLRSFLKQLRDALGSNNKDVILPIYRQIKTYFLSADGKANYVLDNYETLLDDSVLDNLDKSVEQIRQEQNNNITTLRVNINDFIEAANEVYDDARRQEYFNVLDNLKVGDKLTLRTLDGYIEVSKGNVVVGNMSIAKVTPDGRYYVYNEGWREDVNIGSNGQIISNAKQIIEDIFTGQSTNHTSLRKIITDAITTRDISKSLVNRFAANPIINDLANRSRGEQAGERIFFVDNKTDLIDYDRILRHLVKLWNYSFVSNNSIVTNDDIKASLNNWYEKLYHTYNNINYLAQQQDATISYMNEGAINRKVENDTANAYEQFEYASNGIADLSQAALGITAPITNVMVISGHNGESSTWSAGSTVVAIYSRNTKPDFVKAYGLRVTTEEMKQNATFKAMNDAMQNRLISIINSLISNNSDENFSKLVDTITSILACKNFTDYVNPKTKVPIYRAMSGRFQIKPVTYRNTPNIKGIDIIYTGPDGRMSNFHIYNHGANRPQIGYKPANTNRFTFVDANNNITGSTIATDFMNFIAPYVNFNISQAGIALDNNPNADYAGFITRKNGKVLVNIPTEDNIIGFNEEYDSYNQFVLSNNLVKVNTFVGKNGKNFSYQNGNQRANQVLYVDSELGTTTPVEETRYINSNSDAALNQQVYDILNSNEANSNTGERIFQAVKGNKQQIELPHIVDDEGNVISLFPADIRFEPKMNDRQDSRGVIAYTTNDKNHRHIYVYNSPTDKDSTRVGRTVGRVYVGTKWLNMISSNNEAERNIAISKLIHERLHLLIHDAKYAAKASKLYSDIAPIYKEFWKQVNNIRKDANADATLKELANHAVATFQPYFNSEVTAREKLETFKKNPSAKAEDIEKAQRIYNRTVDRLYEEFIVESLTNSAFLNLLNAIESTKQTSRGKQNLFSRIIDAILNFLGITDKINKGSLLEQQINTLANSFNNDDVLPPNVNKDIEQSVSQEIENDVNEVQETQEETNQEEDSMTPDEQDDANAFDEEGDEYEDVDDDANAANIAEPILPVSEEISISSIDYFSRQLPGISQRQFRAMVDRGDVNFRCR